MCNAHLLGLGKATLVMTAFPALALLPQGYHSSLRMTSA